MLRRNGVILLGFCAFVSFLFILLWQYQSPIRSFRTSRPQPNTKSYLHLLIPATASNVQLCRLLYSATVLDYPTPVIIDWNGQDEFDAAASHLAKLRGLLRYLDQLPLNQENDLVLIVDAYDVFFQLRPDVMMQRYFAINDAANKRLAVEHGWRTVIERSMRQTILFGPDKICWPENYGRAACWAVPDSTLPKDAFGPDTDKEPLLTRPRWLNSGTILGPVKDLKDLFAATLVKISETYDPENPTPDSDQMYLADVWGDQEYIRSKFPSAFPSSSRVRREKVAPAEPPEPEEEIVPIIPNVTTTERTEYHVGLDYGSALFQTSADYYPFVTWSTYQHDHAVRTALDAFDNATAPSDFELPLDIANSAPPFHAAQRELSPRASSEDPYEREMARLEQDKSKSWSDILLATNMITKQVFGLFHVTGDKRIRHKWFVRMWYFPYGEALLKASVNAASNEKPISEIKIDGRTWWKWDKNETFSLRSEKGGAWADTGEWLTWDSMCADTEAVVFGRAEPGEEEPPGYELLLAGEALPADLKPDEPPVEEVPP